MIYKIMKKVDFNRVIENLVNYDFSEYEYKNNYTKSTIRCKKHQKNFKKTLKEIRNGNICDLCSKKASSLDSFIVKSKEIWGSDKWEYDKTKYTNSRSKLIVGCKVHNYSFSVYPTQHLKGQKDCKYCVEDGKTEKFINNSKEIWGSNTFDYSRVKYKNNKTEVELICLKHGSFFQRPDNHLYLNNGCPMCSQSKGENMISDILDKNDIIYETQKKFEGCKYKYLLRFDFYLPDYNICIEYNGEQHYESVKYFGGDETLKYNQVKDKIKVDFCEKNKINLITIRYDENVKNKLNLFLK
jgi:hypothetical protein